MRSPTPPSHPGRPALTVVQGSAVPDTSGELARGVYVAPARNAAGGQRLTVIDRDGRERASIDLPAGFEPTTAVWEAARDLLDTLDSDRVRPSLHLGGAH